MFTGEWGPPQTAPDSSGFSPKQHKSREQLWPALSDPEYSLFGQRAAVSSERTILRPTRLHTGQLGRTSTISGPWGSHQPTSQARPRSTSSTSQARPRSTSSTSSLLNNSSMSGEITKKSLDNNAKNGKRNMKHRETELPTPSHIEDNPIKITENIVTDESGNVNCNPSTIISKNKVALKEVADDQNCIATAVLKDTVEVGEVEMSYVCKCHTCGNFCDLNEYQSTHLNECVPPVVQFLKVNCVCGEVFSIEKRLFLANDICSHLHLNNEGPVQEDDVIKETIATFNRLSVSDNEDESQHFNSMPVSSNVNEENDNMATDDMDLCTRNVKPPTEIAIQDREVSVVREEVEEKIMPTTNLQCEPVIDTVERTNTLYVNGTHTNVGKLNADEHENQDALNNERTEEIRSELSGGETSGEERTYLMSVEISEDEAHYNSNSEGEPENDGFDGGNTGNQDGRQDNTELHVNAEEENAWQNVEPPHLTKHHQYNSDAVNLKDTLDNNDLMTRRDDESRDENTEQENGEQGNGNAASHDKAKYFASNDEPSRITEHNNSNGTANLEENLGNNGGMASHSNGFRDRDTDDENGKQDDDVQKVEFDELCAMFKFDFSGLRWITRGPGKLLLLYNPENKTCLLQFQRLVAPGEFRAILMMPIHPGLRLQKMKYNNRAWEWTYHYLTANGNGEFENIGVRFSSQDLADTFHAKFYEVKKQLFQNETKKYMTRCLFATNCPIRPPAREVATPSHVSSAFNAMSPTFNASSPTFDASSPTVGALSPTFSAAEADTAVQADPNDGALAGMSEDIHFDVNMPSTSGTSQTLGKASNNEEIVHELKEIKNRQVETLAEVKILSSLIQQYGISGEEIRVIGTAAKAGETEHSGNLSTNNTDEDNTQENDGSQGTSNKKKENNHMTAERNGETSEFTGGPSAKISSEDNQNNYKNRHDNAKREVQPQQEPTVSKKNENEKKIVSKGKSMETTLQINREPIEQLNESLAVSYSLIIADKDKEQCKNNENKDESREDNSIETGEESKSPTDESKVMIGASTAEILDQPGVSTQTNIVNLEENKALCIKNDAIDSDKNNSNKDTEQQQSLQTSEIIDEVKNETEDMKKNTISQNDASADYQRDDDINKNQEALNSTAEENSTTVQNNNDKTEPTDDSETPELSSSNTVEEKDTKDNTLTEEEHESSEGGEVDTENNSKTTENTNRMDLGSRQIALKIMRLCCTIIFYTFGLAIFTLVTILLIYFFEDIMLSMECLE